MSNDVMSLLMSIAVAVSVVGLIIYIILAASLWKIFNQNGEKGYKAIIPIYNVYILMKIVSMPAWMIILYFIPVVNLFAMAFLSVRIANTFEKGAGFAIGLLFLPFIFYPLLALSMKSTKVEEKVEEKKIIESDDAIMCPNCGTALAKDATSCFVCGEIVGHESTLPEEENEEEPMPVEESIPAENTVMDYETEERPFEMPSDFVFPNEGMVFEPDKEDELAITQEMDPSAIARAYNEESISEMPSYEEEPANINDALQVEDSYKEVEDRPKYKNSTKTLDEILKINSSLYAARNAGSKEPVMDETEQKEKDEQEAEALLSAIMKEEIEEKEPLKEEIKVPEVTDSFVPNVENSEAINEEIISQPFAFNSLDNDEPVSVFADKLPDPEETIVEPIEPATEAYPMYANLPEEDIKQEIPTVEKDSLEKEIEEIKSVSNENIISGDGIGKLRTCPSCGSTIPRYSHRCLLCGTEID